MASPCHFFHKGLQTCILVHGDDFFIVGRREVRKYALNLMRGAYELSKVVTLGLEAPSTKSKKDGAKGSVALFKVSTQLGCVPFARKPM